MSTTWSIFIQLYKIFVSWLLPLISNACSCPLITYWFNLTNMLQHHSITVELRWKLERANERSLTTCFLTFQWKKMSKKMKKNVIRIYTKRPCLATLEADDRVWYVTYQNKVKQTRWETTGKKQMQDLVSSIGHDPVIYKIIPEHNK